MKIAKLVMNGYADLIVLYEGEITSLDCLLFVLADLAIGT